MTLSNSLMKANLDLNPPFWFVVRKIKDGSNQRERNYKEDFKLNSSKGNHQASLFIKRTNRKIPVKAIGLL